MGLLGMHCLQTMLDATQEAISDDELIDALSREPTVRFQPSQHRYELAAAQLNLAPAPNQLEDLSDEFHLADPSGS